MQNSFSRYVNPKVHSLKKWMFDVLKDKYPPHDQIIERAGTALVTDKDIQDFSKLISEVYQLGYAKAINDSKEEFAKHGITISIVSHQNLDTSESIV